jgi:hypothetical protein
MWQLAPLKDACLLYKSYWIAFCDAIANWIKIFLKLFSNHHFCLKPETEEIGAERIS